MKNINKSNAMELVGKEIVNVKNNVIGIVVRELDGKYTVNVNGEEKAYSLSTIIRNWKINENETEEVINEEIVAEEIEDEDEIVEETEEEIMNENNEVVEEETEEEIINESNEMIEEETEEDSIQDTRIMKLFKRHPMFVFGLFALLAYEIAEISINSYFINFVTGQGWMDDNIASIVLTVYVQLSSKWAASPRRLRCLQRCAATAS